MHFNYFANLFLLPIALTSASINEKRQGSSCDPNPVVSVLKAIKATSFCSSYNVIKPTTTTLTVSVTSTNVALTTAINYNTVTQIVATVTNKVQSVLTKTYTATSLATETVYVYEGAVVGRNKRRQLPNAAVPLQLKAYSPSALSKACSCYVPTPTLTATITTTAVLQVIATVSQRAQVTVQDTLTVGVTTTQLASTTTVLSQVKQSVIPVKYALAFSRSQYCYPTRILSRSFSIATDYNAAFQLCGEKCRLDPRCTQISINYGGSATGDHRYDCHLGAGAQSQTQGWGDDARVRCNLDKGPDGKATSYEINMDSYNKV